MWSRSLGEDLRSIVTTFSLHGLTYRQTHLFYRGFISHLDRRELTAVSRFLIIIFYDNLCTRSLGRRKVRRIFLIFHLVVICSLSAANARAFFDKPHIKSRFFSTRVHFISWIIYFLHIFYIRSTSRWDFCLYKTSIRKLIFI